MIATPNRPAANENAVKTHAADVVRSATRLDWGTRTVSVDLSALIKLGDALGLGVGPVEELQLPAEATEWR